MSTRGILQELPSRENCFATRKKKTVGVSALGDALVNVDRTALGIVPHPLGETKKALRNGWEREGRQGISGGNGMTER